VFKRLSAAEAKEFRRLLMAKAAPVAKVRKAKTTAAVNANGTHREWSASVGALHLSRAILAEDVLKKVPPSSGARTDKPQVNLRSRPHKSRH
jgi:hypothetical protein